VCLSTPKPIKGGGFLQKSTKQQGRLSSSSGSSQHQIIIMHNELGCFTLPL
jgi:hypothetical protein